MSAIIWLAAMVILLIVEAGTVALVSIWFAAGALAALIASLLHAAVWLQVVIFFGVSVVLLAALRPVARKYLAPRIIPTNAESIVGKEGYVRKTVDNLAATGEVKLGALPWSCRSTSGRPIAEGTRVRVDRIEGNKVYVTPAEEINS